MRLLKLGFLLLAAYAGMSYAQPNSGNVAPPPPRLEPLEEGSPPDAAGVNIGAPQAPQESISQKRAPGGKVTETQVMSNGSTYYVLPNDQTGSAVSGDMQGRTSRPAQWEILHFDFRSDKEKQKAAEAATHTPAPPTIPTPAPAQK